MDKQRFYITTPIYYVNDRPHIGHVYTTTVADSLARYHRLRGTETFFLTGTDEHAAKVVETAESRGLSPRTWADQNAEEFRSTFARLGVSNDDFIRTSEPRHTQKVTRYIERLLASGDVYEGTYEGWYDAGQEEYLTEGKAKDLNFLSPINGKPLVRKAEQNFFFRLSAYQSRLEALLEAGFVAPSARTNELLVRVREGLTDVPISRSGTSGWGIPVPGHESQTIYVWIDALFNYLSTVDTPERREFWPASVHLIAKDILWFHGIIWPALLMALDEPLPKQVYAHSFWISEGRKMSKSLGNFVDLEKLDAAAERYTLDGLRYFLLCEGPLGITDADFAEARLAEVYTSDLANALGNAYSRTSSMLGRYFGGQIPCHVEDSELRSVAEKAAISARQAYDELRVEDALAEGIALVREVDSFIARTAPFRLAKDPENLPVVGEILYGALESLRIASLILHPGMPSATNALWQRMGLPPIDEALSCPGDWERWSQWGRLSSGNPVEVGEPLFPRLT